jgi:anti-sigma regulatory factor (Ser/Thr protein kinase)
MVLTEAVTNVIQHGAEAGKGQEISVILEQVGGDIRVEVRDGGQPFDPLKQPEVVFPRTLDDASRGGLGIHLIRSYSDECRYRREGGENILTLVIRAAEKTEED